MYIVNVKTERESDGCYSRSFDSLNDDVREFIKSRAASFRACNPSLKCEAVILRNGDKLANARVIFC